MRVICEIKSSDIMPGSVNKDPSAFAHRRASRAIVTNHKGEVALLYVGKYGYHKLPGGGIEHGEDIEQALERELLEEIGCAAEIIDEVGEIIEYRDEWDQKQTSYCYRAKQVGEAHPPMFTEKELSNGFEIVWAPNLTAARTILAHDTSRVTDYGARFITARDHAFLQAAA